MKFKFCLLFVFLLVLTRMNVVSAVDERISIDLKDVTIADALKMIAQKGGRSIVVGGPVRKGLVSVNLKDQGVDEAFNSVAVKNGLMARKFGTSEVTVFRKPYREQPSDYVERLSAANNATTVTLEFMDADIGDLLRLVAKKSGVNIIMEKSVRGNLSCLMTDVPWIEAVKALTLGGGYEAGWFGKTLIVADRRILAEIGQPLSGSGEEMTASKTTSIDVRDADIRDVFGKITKFFGRNFIAGSSVRGNITVSLTDLPEGEMVPLLARVNGYAAELVNGLWVIDNERRLPKYRSLLAKTVKNAKADPVSISFRTAKVTEILEFLAKKSPQPIVSDIPKHLAISLQLTDMDRETAIRAIALAGNLVVEEQPDHSLRIRKIP